MTEKRARIRPKQSALKTWGTERRSTFALALCLLTMASAAEAAEDEASAGAAASTTEAPAAEAKPSGTSLYPVSEEDMATARLHMANGVELLQAEPPNYQDAYGQFQLALGKSGRSWKVLGNLALCSLKLERDGEALVLYEEYLERGGDSIDPREKQSIEREVLLARSNLATVSLESSDPAAKISVERQGSNAPVQKYALSEGKAELGVRSGTLIIVAESKGKRLEWKPVLAAGESASHVFDFDAAPPETAAAAATTSDSTTDGGGGMSPMRIAGIATAGVGVASLGGGLILGIMSQSKEDAAREDCIDTTCLESAEAEFDSAKSMATVANVLFIAGGVLTATGVTLVILGGNKGTEHAATLRSHTSLALSPVPLPAGGGFFAHGTF